MNLTCATSQIFLSFLVQHILCVRTRRYTHQNGCGLHVVLDGFTFAFWSLILQFLWDMFVAEPFHTFHRNFLSNMN